MVNKVNKIISRSQEILNRKSSSILSAAAIIAISYLASALLGLVRNHLLAAFFYGADLDVYFAAFVIPDTIFQLLVVGAVSAAFIPVYQDYFSKSEEDANHMANAALTIIGGLLFLLTAVIMIFARPLAGVLAHFSPKELDLMANLIRLMSIAQLFFTLSAFLTGVLQSRQRFLIPAIAPILYNLGTIIGIIVLGNRFGIYAAAAGVVFGSLLHFIVQLPTAKSLGYTPGLNIKPNHPGVRTMLRLMPPRTLALGLDQIERAVAVNLTSMFAIGSLSMFNFARQLYILPISLFGVSLSQASFPSLAAEAGSQDRDKFIKTLSSSILQIFFFALPASVLILVLRVPLVRIAFGSRSFPWDATLTTARALSVLALSIAPQAVTHTLTRALHALKDTKTPVYSGIITMIIFVGGSYIFGNVLNLGVVGITGGMALSNTVDFVLLYMILRSRIGSLHITFRLFKMVVVSVITGFFLWIPMRLLDQFVFDTTHTLPLVALTLTVSAVGFAVYLLFCYIFRIEELKEVILMAKKVGNWRKILVSSDEVIETTVNE